MKILILALSLMFALHSHASVTYGQDFTNIGLSSYVYESPYKSEEVENTWSPYIALQYENFFIRDIELGYQFLTTYDYGAAISLSGDELNKQQKNKNKTINEGLNLKGSFSVYRQSGIYTLTAMQDISGVHNGKESTLSWLYTLRGLGLTWYPNLYASWMDEALVQHYFSGNKEDSVKANSGWRYGIGVTADYHPAQRWLVQTVIANEHYSTELAEESFGNEVNTWLLTVNMGYYF